MHLPHWATRARNIFRALWRCYAFLLLIAVLIRLVNLIFDTSMLTEGSPTWANVFLLGLLALGVISGLLWLAGAVVAGYQEPEEE